MIGLFLSTTMAVAGTISLDRVEILSDDPGTWLHYELPLARHRPATAALLFIEQVQPVWQTPWRDVRVGTSLSVQTIQIERPLGSTPLQWSAGLQTALLCPRGIVAGIHGEWGRFHLSAGLSASSMASWQNRSWSQWTMLPTAGFGITR